MTIARKAHKKINIGKMLHTYLINLLLTNTNMLVLKKTVTVCNETRIKALIFISASNIQK
jgi:hypothetical protein